MYFGLWDLTSSTLGKLQHVIALLWKAGNCVGASGEVRRKYQEPSSQRIDAAIGWMFRRLAKRFIQAPPVIFAPRVPPPDGLACHQAAPCDAACDLITLESTEQSSIFSIVPIRQTRSQNRAHVILNLGTRALQRMNE